MKLLRDQRGQAAVLMAVSIVCVCGLAGMAVDVGMMFRAKRVLQIAADAGAISGAAELNYGDATSAAKAATDQNGLTDGANGVTVTVNNPPLAGPSAGKSGYVEVTVSQPQPTYFMRLFRWNSMTVKARAVASVLPSRSCVATLGTVSPGISVTNGAHLTLPGCSITDNAIGGNAFYVSGGASVSASSIAVVGGASLNNGVTVTPTPATGAGALLDPIASFATPPPASSYSSGCVTDPAIHTSQTISPGCYLGLSFPNGSPTVNMNPGLYIINGPKPLNVASGTVLNGSGVTFYFVNGASFVFSNGANVTLSAPTSGLYRGLVLYQDPTDTAADSFIGGSTANLNGIIYLPSASFTMSNGNSSLSTDLVVGSLSMTGGASLQPYTPPTGMSPLATTSLTE